MFLLGVYLTAPLILLGWIATMILFFAGQTYLPVGVAFFLASTSCNAVGNFASFFEIGSSVLLDGAERRIRLLPLNVANFLFSTTTVAVALVKYYVGRARGHSLPWNKTERHRNGNGNGNGWTNGNGEANGNGRGLSVVKARAAAQNSGSS